MFKKLLVLCFALLALTALTHAQLGDPIFRQYPTLTSAEVVKADDGSLSFIVRGDFPDGCEADIQVYPERVGVAWFIDIYRELPIGVMCPAVMQPFEQSIDATALLELDENETLPVVIIVNGKIYGVNHAQIDGEASDAPAPILDEYWVRSEIPVQTVKLVQNDDDTTDISFEVTLSDSCAQVVYRAYGVWDQEGQMNLDVYTVFPINAGCLMEERTESYTIEGLMFYALSINGANFDHNSMTVESGEYAYIVQPMGLDSVTAEWVADENGMQVVKLTAKGYTDGCEFPAQVLVGQPVDNYYTVQVVRVAPADVACTMIAREFTAEHTFVPTITLDAPLMFMVNNQFMVELPLE